MLKLLQYCNYIIIVMQIKLMLLLLLLLLLSSTLQKWLLFFAYEVKSGYFIGLNSSVKRGETFSFHELFSTLSDVL